MAHLGPLPDAARTVKVRLIGLNQTFPWVNVFHIQWNSGGVRPDSAGLATMATNIRTLWTSAFAAQFITNSSLTTVECTDISDRTGGQGIDSTAVSGTNATAGASLSTAACVSWTINRRYRGGHPRTYLSGVDASAFTSGKLWTPAKVTAYTTAANAWRTGLEALTNMGNTWQMVNVSYYKTVGGLPAYKNPPDIDHIVGQKFHTRIDTQRRRLGKEAT